MTAQRVREASPRDDVAAGSTLILPQAVRDDLAAWIVAGYPNETCGLLLGCTGTTEVAVFAARQARNLNRERARDRYELDPADFVAADRAARERSLDIVGIWHSHPDSPAEPSQSDRLAAWTGWSYLIVSVASSGIRELRSWRLVHDRFIEEVVKG